MVSEKIIVRGIPYDSVTLPEALDSIRGFLSSGKTNTVVTPNAEIAQRCVEDETIRSLVTDADLVIPDGAGVVLAARILGTPLKCKVPGCELGELIVSRAADEGFRIFFLGGKPGVAALAEEKLREKYPGFHTVGVLDGYFSKEGPENEAVLAEIRESHADILFVCLGFPAQERWMHDNRGNLPAVRVMLGLGGSLDCYAGTVRRAPKVFIRLGLEWFYRLLCQPSRAWRMRKLPKFLIGTVFCRLTGRKG